MKKKKKKKSVGQLSLRATAGHGGARANAGRPPKPPGERRVAHVARPAHAKRHPVHVTMRARRGVPSFRCEMIAKLFERIVAEIAGAAFRVVHHSIQHNHVHFIVEALDKPTLSSGVRSVAIRFAKRLARAFGQPKGKVWGDRCHEHVLKTPREVRNALVYVLHNAKKHGLVAHGSSFVDAYSSGRAFDGWADAAPEERAAADPESWLLRVGWRRHGLVRTTDAPREVRT